MKFKFLVILIFLFLVTFVKAENSTVISTLGFQPYQRWLDSANVSGPVIEIRVFNSISGCSDGGLACVWTDRDPPEIWINNNLSKELERGIFLHEVGHIVHDQLTLEEQERFAEIDSKPFNLEYFADGYMYCALGNRKWGRELPGPFPQWKPTKVQYKQTCELIKEII